MPKSLASKLAWWFPSLSSEPIFDWASRRLCLDGFFSLLCPSGQRLCHFLRASRSNSSHLTWVSFSHTVILRSIILFPKPQCEYITSRGLNSSFALWIRDLLYATGLLQHCFLLDSQGGQVLPLLLELLSRLDNDVLADEGFGLTACCLSITNRSDRAKSPIFGPHFNHFFRSSKRQFRVGKWSEKW